MVISICHKLPSSKLNCTVDKFSLPCLLNPFEALLYDGADHASETPNCPLFVILLRISDSVCVMPNNEQLLPPSTSGIPVSISRSSRSAHTPNYGVSSYATPEDLVLDFVL